MKASFCLRSSKNGSWKSQPKSGARMSGAAASQGRAPKTTTVGSASSGSSTVHCRPLRESAGSARCAGTRRPWGSAAAGRCPARWPWRPPRRARHTRPPRPGTHRRHAPSARPPAARRPLLDGLCREQHTRCDRGVPLTRLLRARPVRSPSSVLLRVQSGLKDESLSDRSACSPTAAGSRSGPARREAEVSSVPTGPRPPQQVQGDLRRARLLARPAADARPGQVERPDELPGEVARAVGGRREPLRLVLLGKALVAVAHRARPAARVALDALADCSRQNAHRCSGVLAISSSSAASWSRKTQRLIGRAGRHRIGHQHLRPASSRVIAPRKRPSGRRRTPRLSGSTALPGEHVEGRTSAAGPRCRPAAARAAGVLEQSGQVARLVAGLHRSRGLFGRVIQAGAPPRERGAGGSSLRRPSPCRSQGLGDGGGKAVREGPLCGLLALPPSGPRSGPSRRRRHRREHRLAVAGHLVHRRVRPQVADRSVNAPMVLTHLAPSAAEIHAISKPPQVEAQHVEQVAEERPAAAGAEVAGSVVAVAGMAAADEHAVGALQERPQDEASRRCGRCRAA